MVELVGVRKRYRRVGEVLAGVSLSVQPGSLSVVMGANGSGKSTLLRIAAGCTSPSQGTVRGRAAVVGYLPAQFPASSRLSVRGYLRHLGAIHGAGRNADVIGEAVLGELGFSGALEGSVAELSTGNAQKVGLAQALSARAGLLVLDEPWTALDEAAAEALSRRLATVSQRAGVLIADHSGRGGELACAMVHRLERGRLEPVSVAEPASVADSVTDPVGVGPVGEGPVGEGRRGAVEVVLRCPVPAAEVVSSLPPTDDVVVHGRLARVWVEPGSADAFMAAALAAGCSLRSVTWPESPDSSW